MHRHHRGLTLIEVLIVVVIIGVLAAIAIPKFTGAKHRAYFAGMKSDLRNLATAQEIYHQASGTYYDGPVPLPGVDYRPTTGVTITISDASSTGWAATATQSAMSGKACAVFYGSAAAVPPATTEGEITCR